MNNPKIAILLGRGVEGCGVTKNAIEFNKFYPNSQIFSVMDKKWPRKNSMEFSNKEFLCTDDEAVQSIINIINKDFDAVIVFSLPSLKHPKKTADNFITLLQKIQVPKSMIQVDHSIMSLVRNAKMKEACENVDLLMTHSLDGAFSKWCNENDVTTPLIKMSVGFNYDKHRAQFWKPISEQQDNHIKWIGRCALWKGPNEMITLHNNYLRNHNFITTLEGLEASVQATIIIYENNKSQIIEPKKLKDIHDMFRGPAAKKAASSYGKEEVNNPPYLYPAYSHDDCMHRLSKCAFGSDLYNLKAHFYGNNIEYCHAEVVASGTVPLFHKHFGDNIYHRKTGNIVSQDDSGTVWYDPNNLENTVNTLVKLSKDQILRDEQREKAFTYWKDHSNADDVYLEIINNTLTSKSLNRNKKQTNLLDLLEF